MQTEQDIDELIERIDARHRAVSAQQRGLFQLIADCDDAEVWRDSGARDMPHWLGMRYGIS